MKRSFGVSMLLGFLALFVSACSSVDSVDMVKLAELDPSWKECRIPEGVMISWDITLQQRWKASYTDPATQAKFKVKRVCSAHDTRSNLFAIDLFVEQKQIGGDGGFVRKKEIIRSFASHFARKWDRWEIEVKERKNIELQDGFTAKVLYVLIKMEGVSRKKRDIKHSDAVAVAFIRDNSVPDIRYVLTSFPYTGLPEGNTQTWYWLDEFLKSFRRTEKVALLQ